MDRLLKNCVTDSGFCVICKEDSTTRFRCCMQHREANSNNQQKPLFYCNKRSRPDFQDRHCHTAFILVFTFLWSTYLFTEC